MRLIVRNAILGPSRSCLFPLVLNSVLSPHAPYPHDNLFHDIYSYDLYAHAQITAIAVTIMIPRHLFPVSPI